MAASSESERLQSLSHIGLSLVLTALVFTILGAWYASSRPVAAIDAKKLDNYQQSLLSYAAESYLLADQYRHSRALANYTVVSTDKLHQAVSELAGTLETSPADSAVISDIKDTADQADDLAVILGDLAKAAAAGKQADFTGKLQDIQREVGSL